MTVKVSASDSPSATAAIDNCSLRVDTFRTTIVRVACHRLPCQKAKALAALHRLQKLPEVVRSFFQDPNLRYITADAPTRNTPAPTQSGDAFPRCA